MKKLCDAAYVDPDDGSYHLCGKVQGCHGLHGCEDEDCPVTWESTNHNRKAPAPSR